MTGNLEQTLSGYGEQALTVKVCRTIFSMLPTAPTFVLYQGLPGAIERVNPVAGATVAAQVEAAARSAETERALWVADALDKADAGLAAYSGLRSVLSLFGGNGSRRRTFESDPQQAIDATLKLLGLSYMVAKLFDGSTSGRASKFLSLPAGREVALYYAAAEVALPFADNVAEGTGQLISRIVAASGGEGASRFGQVAGGQSVLEAKGVLAQLVGPLESALQQARAVVAPLTEKLRSYLPAAVSMADSVTGAAATGLDALPIWRFLGARLAAESCVARVLADSASDVSLAAI